MRIRDLQARAVVAPLEPPVRTASGHVTQAPLLLIDLTTDEGIVGRSYLFGYHAFTLAPLRELVVALGEIVKGNVLAPVELDKTMRSRMRSEERRVGKGRQSRWRGQHGNAK